MIRTAKPEDCKRVYLLICSLEQMELDYHKFTDIYLGQLSDPNYYLIVWEEDSSVLGYLSLRMEYQLHHVARIAEVLELVVEPDCRSNGIGKQLLEHAYIFARRNSCELIELSCNLSRVEAHRFYERNGMKRTHARFTMKLR